MFHPKTDGFVSVLSAVVLFAEQSHEVVLRYGDFRGGTGVFSTDVFYDLVVTYRSAFYDKKCVAEIVVASPIAYLRFEVRPVGGVETAHLRTHVGEVERLSVGIHGEEAVGRRTEVTALVTAPAEITQFISFSGGNIRIGLEGIALPDFAVPFCTFPIIT